jgi:hypothetical protein
LGVFYVSEQWYKPKGRLLWTLKDGTDVVGVDGEDIRDNLDVGWAAGGNPGADPYCPKGQIWIELPQKDEDGIERQQQATCVHEYTEQVKIERLRAEYKHPPKFMPVSFEEWLYLQGHHFGNRREASFRRKAWGAKAPYVGDCED